MMGVPTHSSRQFRFAVLGIIFLTVAIRLPSLLHPQPIDSEAMYSVVANEIVNGGRPYIDAIERKPPLLFWTYAAIFKVAGEFNWKALHIVALVWTLGAMAAVPVGVYLLLPSYRASRSLTRTNSIIQAALLTAGFLAALGLVTIVLWKQGILREAFYWTIADHDVPHVFWQKGIVHTLGFLGACLPLVIGAIMACWDKDEIWAERPAERTALFGLLAASVIGAAAGARFYP